VVSINERAAWDLSFDCDPSRDFVYLNTALNASIAETNQTDIKLVRNDNGLTYQSEHHSGKDENLALGNVRNNQRVFVLDRGFMPNGDPIGKWKIKISTNSNGEYVLETAPLSDTNITRVSISKNSLYNRIAYSITTASITQIEPPKEDYDLVFTQYTQIFDDLNPPLAYSVNGVLINSYKTSVAREFDREFDMIDSAHAEMLSYIDDMDAIGYDWKSFDFNQQVFTILPKRNYIIKDSKDRLYVLRFLDFYDQNGIKGAPSFEYKRLK
jgi:hypothetical protein